MNDFGIDAAASRSGFDSEEVVYARWLAGLFDGLVSPDSRLANEHQLLLHVRAMPLLFAAFVSGAVSDLLRSLPAEDPWRHTALVQGTVLSVRGDLFGTMLDATDLIVPNHPDFSSDPRLAAFDSPLSTLAALLIHLCAQSWSTARETLAELIRGGLAGEDLYCAGCAAIRWAIHRRRVYTGAEDPYSFVVTRAWVRRARSAEKGQPWDEARRARLATQEKVPDGLYEWFTAR